MAGRRSFENSVLKIVKYVHMHTLHVLCIQKCNERDLLVDLLVLRYNKKTNKKTKNTIMRAMGCYRIVVGLATLTTVMQCSEMSSTATQLKFGPYLVGDGDIFNHLDSCIQNKVHRPTLNMDPVIVADFPWEGSMHM